MRSLLLLALLAAAPFDGTPRNELVAGSSQRAVAATAGGGCYAYAQAAGSAGHSYEDCDYGGPLELRGHLPVRHGRLVALDFDAPVVRVNLRVRDGSSVPAEPAGGTTPTRRWLARVPEEWEPGAIRLGAHAFYGNSPDRFDWDLNYEFGLLVLRRGTGRVTMPRLAGRPLAKALRELERRGLGWRLDGSREIAFDTGPPPPPDAAVRRQRRRVTGQDIRPGRRLRRQSVVDLTTRPR